MNAQELAAALNGCEYRNEVSTAIHDVAAANGLVIVFGASDDLMEFEGAIVDEVSCYEGGNAYLTSNGLLTNECDDEDCPHFKRLLKSAAKITARWCVGEYSWAYETKIPHCTFDVLEDGEKYCSGIVFALTDAKWVA